MHLNFTPIYLPPNLSGHFCVVEQWEHFETNIFIKFGGQKCPQSRLNLNFLQKVKFLQTLGLNYSRNNKSTDKMKYTTRIPCSCPFWNTPYLNWLLLISPSGGLSKFAYIWYFLIFSSDRPNIQNCQMYLNFDRPSLGLIKSNQIR